VGFNIVTSCEVKAEERIASGWWKREAELALALQEPNLAQTVEAHVK